MPSCTGMCIPRAINSFNCGLYLHTVLGYHTLPIVVWEVFPIDIKLYCVSVITS